MSYQREKKVGGVDASRSGRGTWSQEEDQIIISSIQEVQLKRYNCIQIIILFSLAIIARVS